jgi:hypothetical protein
MPEASERSISIIRTDQVHDQVVTSPPLLCFLLTPYGPW